MNKQKFIELLNKPGDLKEVNLKELDDLVAENPYFQAARVLEARGHRLLKHKEAGIKTASAAIYSTNRIILKNYLAGDGTITAKPVAPPPAQKPASPQPTAPAEIPVQQTPAPPSPSIIPEPAATAGSSDIDHLIYNLHKDMEELEKSRARYIEVTRKIEEEEAVEKAVKKATKNTEKTTATSASKASGTKTKSATTSKALASKRTSSTTTKSTSAKKSTAGKKTTSAKTTKSATKPKASSTKASTVKKTSTKPSTRKTSPKTTAKKSSSRTSRSSKTTKTSKKEDSDGENQHQLIDQFIKKNPSFKPAPENSTQSDLSEESTSLPEDVGTEYLAEIFLNQGKKDKALKIYNSLMLRFPEKKAYFAGRIKKIK